MKIFVCRLHPTWPNFSENIFSNDYFEQLICASLTKLIGPTRKIIKNEKFVFHNTCLIFWQGWVGATREKSKYMLPRFVGQNIGGVPWISVNLYAWFSKHQPSRPMLSIQWWAWIFKYSNIQIFELKGSQILFVFAFVPFPQYEYIWIFIRRFLDNQIHFNICL